MGNWLARLHAVGDAEVAAAFLVFVKYAGVFLAYVALAGACACVRNRRRKRRWGG